MSAARHRAEIPLAPDPAPEPPQWKDPAANRTGQLVWQFIGVGLLGGCAPFVLDGVAHGYELGGTTYTVATTGMLLVVGAGLITLLYLLVRATPLVTPLGATRRGRLLWAALIAGGGTIAVLLGRTFAAAHDDGLLHNGRLAVLLGGSLTVLVAAALTGGWWLRAPAAVALIVLTWTGLIAFRDTGPTELEMRLTQAGADRTEMWTVTVPGYRVVHQTFGLAETGDEYLPAPGSAAGRLVLTTVDLSQGCRPPRCADPDYLLLTPGQAVVLPGSPTRVVMLRGHQVLELTAPIDADTDRLRDALQASRPATDPELLGALPAAPAGNPIDAFRIWLRHHT
ncbi:hypothetical protein [Actinoplanes sp. HUAS TT8]|uniref:hypothetical protein n=1 Tax=Actinoplanes sp. HUAS TT8 TaxID=3447453 RepID=UPI003F523740